ncbi:MAG: hypothetical protein U0168_23130 [Nannocystaceae bacterium]
MLIAPDRLAPAIPWPLEPGLPARVAEALADAALAPRPSPR